MTAGTSWAHDTDHTRALRAAMVASLITAGELKDPAWRHAFAAVARHVLVPRYYRGNDYSQVSGAAAADREEWLASVYSDETLITQVTPQTVTSSGTMPSLLAEMLHELRVRDGDRVLQIGTGTGYTAALLCARLTSGQVTTMDIDQDLVRAAAERLAELGYQPTCVTGDGAEGHPAGGPYDHVIATCAVPSIPAGWLTQTRLGGRIVAPMATGLIALDVQDARHATGRFLSTAGYFMPLRRRAGTVAEPPAVRAGDHREPRPTRYGAMDTVYQSDLRILLAVAASDIRFGQHSQRIEDVIARDGKGSWAEVETREDGSHVVIEGGPRQLWTEIGALVERWRELGSPARERYGLTITPDGQRVWLDDPCGINSWDVRTPAS